MLYYSDLTVNSSSSSSLVVFGCLNKSVKANNKSTKANKRSGWEEKSGRKVKGRFSSSSQNIWKTETRSRNNSKRKCQRIRERCEAKKIETNNPVSVSSSSNLVADQLLRMNKNSLSVSRSEQNVKLGWNRDLQLFSRKLLACFFSWKLFVRQLLLSATFVGESCQPCWSHTGNN